MNAACKRHTEYVKACPRCRTADRNERQRIPERRAYLETLEAERDAATKRAETEAALDRYLREQANQNPDVAAYLERPTS
jgi:hypothetical protein